MQGIQVLAQHAAGIAEQAEEGNAALVHGVRQGQADVGEGRAEHDGGLVHVDQAVIAAQRVLGVGLTVVDLQVDLLAENAALGVDLVHREGPAVGAAGAEHGAVAGQVGDGADDDLVFLGQGEASGHQQHGDGHQDSDKLLH